MRHVLDELSDKLIFVTMRNKGGNETQVALVSEADEIKDLTPCWMEVSWSDIEHHRRLRMVVSPSCKVVYVMFPRFLSLSDAIRVSEDLEDIRFETRPIVFVLNNTSPKVRAIVTQNFPNAKIISFSS